MASYLGHAWSRKLHRVHPGIDLAEVGLRMSDDLFPLYLFFVVLVH